MEGYFNYTHKDGSVTKVFIDNFIQKVLTLEDLLRSNPYPGVDSDLQTLYDLVDSYINDLNKHENMSSLGYEQKLAYLEGKFNANLQMFFHFMQDEYTSTR